MYKKYYSYNDMPVPVNTKKTEIKPVTECTPAVNGTEHKEKNEVCEKNAKSGGIGGILANLQMDDIILIIVVIALLMEDCEDKILLAAIAFILFSS